MVMFPTVYEDSDALDECPGAVVESSKSYIKAKAESNTTDPEAAAEMSYVVTITKRGSTDGFKQISLLTSYPSYPQKRVQNHKPFQLKPLF